MTMPDISAEILLGATGWAAGNQMCKGIMPALTPKPRNRRRKAAAPKDGVSVWPIPWSAVKSKLPAPTASSRKPISIIPEPPRDISRYSSPPFRDSSDSWWNTTRKYAETVISYQAIRKNKTLDAVKTSVNERRRRFRKKENTPELSPGSERGM